MDRLSGFPTMIHYAPQKWCSLVFRWRGSVLPHVVWEMLLAGMLGVIAFYLSTVGVQVGDLFSLLGSDITFGGEDSEVMDDKVHTLLVFPMGFLLVFRTNSAYARYWYVGVRGTTPPPPSAVLMRPAITTREGRGHVGQMVRSCREIMRIVAALSNGALRRRDAKMGGACTSAVRGHGPACRSNEWWAGCHSPRES